MLDALLATFTHAAQVVIGLLGAELAAASGWALMLSICSTQFFKMMPFVAHITPRRRRWLVIQGYAIAVCLLAMLLLYDEPPLARRLVVSFSIAFIPPISYFPVAWIVWRWAPQIGKAMSGDPRYLDLPPKREPQ